MPKKQKPKTGMHTMGNGKRMSDKSMKQMMGKGTPLRGKKGR